MSRDDFDRDLENYLHARRKGSGVRSFFNSLFATAPKSRPPAAPREAHVRDEVSRAIKEHKEETRQETAKTQEYIEVKVQEEPEIKKEHAHSEGFFARFFGKKEEPVSTESNLITKKEKEEAVNDLKEVAKITLRAIQNCPDENVHKFKQSTDFLKLKTVLRKYDLIK